MISSVHALVLLFRLLRIHSFCTNCKTSLELKFWEGVWVTQSERKNKLPVYRVFRLAWWSSLFLTSTYYHFQENIIHGYGLDLHGPIASNKILFFLFAATSRQVHIQLIREAKWPKLWMWQTPPTSANIYILLRFFHTPYAFTVWDFENGASCL
jgi:hypothetical protein